MSIDASKPTYFNHLGAAHAALGQMDEAEDAFRRALALDAGNSQSHYNLAALLNLRKRPDEAIESYRRAVELAPQFAEAHFNLGNMLRDAGRLAEAEQCYAGALRARDGATPDRVMVEALLRG